MTTLAGVAAIEYLNPITDLIILVLMAKMSAIFGGDKKVDKTKISDFWQKNQKIIVVAAAAIILTSLILLVRAGTNFASFESEGGLLSGSTAIKSSTAASGGNYVEFLSSTSGTNPPCSGVTINVGEGWQNKVDANPNGTTFCVKAGTHKRVSVNVKPNNTFIGENGTVLDGESVTSRAFYGNFGDDYVTIRNMEIKRYVPGDKLAVVGTKDTEKFWTLDKLNINNNAEVGVRVNRGWKVLNSKLSANGRYAIAGAGADILIEGNELFNNPGASGDAGATKFVFTRNLVLRNNYVHDNRGNGLWVDINNVGTLYEGNRVINNGRNGIFHEISCDAIIRNNYVEGNGYKNTVYEWALGGGIQTSNSPDVQVYGNTLVNNRNGISGINWDHPNLGAVTACEPRLKNYKVYNNNVTDPGDATVMGIDGNIDRDKVWSTWGNQFYNNKYNLNSNSRFRWGGSYKTFSEWQALGQY